MFVYAKRSNHSISHLTGSGRFWTTCQSEKQRFPRPQHHSTHTHTVNTPAQRQIDEIQTCFELSNRTPFTLNLDSFHKRLAVASFLAESFDACPTTFYRPKLWIFKTSISPFFAPPKHSVNRLPRFLEWGWHVWRFRPTPTRRCFSISSPPVDLVCRWKVIHFSKLVNSKERPVPGSFTW